jgi:hypothetical protein
LHEEFSRISRSAAGFEPRWSALNLDLIDQSHASAPTFDFSNVGWLMPQNDATKFVTLVGQVPQAWRRVNPGVLKPRIQFIQTGANSPTFKIDYRLTVLGEAPGTITTITHNALLIPYVSGSILQEAQFPDIEGERLLGTLVEMKVYRDDDTVTGDVLVKRVDVLALVDDLGSANP